MTGVRSESEQQLERVSIRLGGVRTGIVLGGEVVLSNNPIDATTERLLTEGWISDLAVPGSR